MKMELLNGGLGLIVEHFDQLRLHEFELFFVDLL
jgi:hypothetical protein